MNDKNEYVKSKYPTVRKNLLELNYPEFIYLLGFFWADGWVSVNEKRGKSRERNTVGFSIVEDDFKNIEHCFHKTGEWQITRRVRIDKRIGFSNCKPSVTVRVYGREMTDIFSKYGFDKKSNTSPLKVLKCISTDLHCYFWRGYFDGDGYIGDHKATITSCKDHDWKYCVDYFNNIGIQCGIVFSDAYSCISFTDRKNLCNLFSFLYPNGYDFGLKRKYDKFELVKKYLENANSYLSNRGEKFICQYYRGSKTYYLFCISRKKCKHQKTFTSKESAISYRDEFLIKNNIVGYSITGNRPKSS